MNLTGNGKLTFFCGKMGAGKSTYANQLSKRERVILLSEDEWLSQAYPGEVRSIDDYLVLSLRIKPIVKALAIQLLAANNHVVMDFPENTIKQRAWFRAIIDESGTSHQLVFIHRDDTICLEQIMKRRQLIPESRQTDTPEMFAAVTKYFEPPNQNESFEILMA